MLFRQKDYSLDVFYHLMVQAIIPRPIAWVLSKNPNGSHNIAPFSFFNGVASQPPLLMISVGWKDKTTRKDTWVNIDERDEFVVHIPPSDMTEAMVATSRNLPLNESELDHAKLTTALVDGETLPRVVGPKVAMFCRKYSITELGPERMGMILGEIKNIWVDDDAVKKEGPRTLIDPKIIDPVTRFGGLQYGFLGEIKDVGRPR